MRRFTLIVQVFMLVVGLGLGSWVTEASSTPAASRGANRTYIVLYKEHASTASANATVRAAGGVLVANYGRIGVVVARSRDVGFAVKTRRQPAVEGVSATESFAVRAPNQPSGPRPPFRATTVVANGDNLSGLQWDMGQIHVPESHGITAGSSSVLVGDIDTGLDFTHPDLAPNVDFATSVSCVGGVPDQTPAAWDDDFGHGTHTAGTIAAAANGVGIVGVAPKVRIAAIKASTPAGLFFPEAVVCAFVWAGTHRMQVTNNSYFADPWLFNCRNDPEQHAIWKAEQRAIRFAMHQGVTVVAAIGNENQDLSKKNLDTISPSPQPRVVPNACVQIPVEIPGVIGVSANGNLGQKAFYSNYGVGVTDVAAPGGDSLFQVTPEAPTGTVLSTWPAKFTNPGDPLAVLDCSVSPCATYYYLQGTSMAAPHVAGVAALVQSRHGPLPPGRVQSLITRTADAQPCPPNPFDPGQLESFLAICRGGRGSNGFFGHGQVNTLRAVR